MKQGLYSYESIFRFGNYLLIIDRYVPTDKQIPYN